MDCTLPARYKEVPLLQRSMIKNKKKLINVTCGGYHSMLVDSKTSELSGGFNLHGSRNGRQQVTRFVHWRTFSETLYLTETCLHRNDVCHEVKITFEGSPILSVDIHSHLNSVAFILITTTTSFHRIPIANPESADHHLHIEPDSVLLKLDEHIISDPMNCYAFVNDIGQSLPVTATAMHSPDHSYSKFAVATANSLYLFTMVFGCDKPDVKFVELENSSLSISKFIHHIADSWRRRTHTSQVVTMSFSPSYLTENQSLLYTLHRDGALRVWQHCGRFLSAEYLSKYTQGSETEFHSCVLRRSKSLVGLFFSFQTFSEFIILRPLVSMDANTGSISSLVLQKVCTILSPNYDLIDFKLCDQSLWSLWCNSEGEMQTLAYELTTKDVFETGRNLWLPVVMESATDTDQPCFNDGTDLRDVYCNRIFHSGLFSDKVIRKTLTMFNPNLAGIAGNSTTGNMVRLKRYVLTCVESQLQQEQATMRQNAPFDNEQLIEISNGLWEKFYLYCTQYNYDSSRPVGLFLFEEQVDGEPYITVGMVRKKYVSFFRNCDRLEVAFYAPSSDGLLLSPESQEAKEENELPHETVLLVNFLREIEQTLPKEQKHELDSYVHQRHEKGVAGDTLAVISATQNHSLVHISMPAFLQSVSDLPGAIGGLLQWLKPTDRSNPLSNVWQGTSESVSVYTDDQLAGELVLVTAKQSIQLRYIVLRNLFLLEHIIQHHCNLSYEVLDTIQSTLRPDTETMLRCYHVMNWIAHTRLDLDWTKTNKMAASFPMNLRTSMTLLQAYATSRLNDNTLSKGSLIEGNSVALSLMKKTDILIAHLSPSSDDFAFGEWLSDNDLHIYIDEYVRLLNNWCEWNCSSRNFIKAKSYLMLGDTSKALDLFPLSLEGIQSDRFMQKFLRQNDKNRNISPYETLSVFYLRLIRLFEFYGAYDGVMMLVHSAIDNTIQQKQQAMFQSIEFSSHIELSHYEEAYNTLTKNCDSARKKDCLRQLICLLFNVRRLDILMSLPYYGLEEEFTNIVAINARSADIADGVQYDFLYSFYINKMNLRKAAITSYEEAMRNYIECTSYDHLHRYYRSLLKCLNSLAIIKPMYAWILRPAIENNMGQIIPSCANRDKIEIVDMKELYEQLMITYCALQLSQRSDGFKLVTSLEPTELIALLLSRKMYHLALKLAHRRVHSMVPTIYEHLTSICLVASNRPSSDTQGSATHPVPTYSVTWLNENCISDIAVGSDGASTAWNYLRHMIEQEKGELATNAHLAVLNRVISRGAHVPTWLKAWCFEHAPVRLIRSYMSQGRLEEAYECMIELLKTNFFSSGRFCRQTLFPLSVIDHLLYELGQSEKYSKEKDHIEQYLHRIEAVFS